MAHRMQQSHAVYDARMESTERLAWIAKGFQPVAYIELVCTCGTFRSASPNPLKNYPCPGCHKYTLPARIIGDGVSKTETFTWERIEKQRFGRYYSIPRSQNSLLAT
jgi:hypothetical protein